MNKDIEELYERYAAIEQQETWKDWRRPLRFEEVYKKLLDNLEPFGKDIPDTIPDLLNSLEELLYG